MLCRVVGRWATEVQEESKLQQRGAMMGKGVEDWTTGTNDGGRQAEMVEGRKCTEYSRSDMRHVQRRRRRRRRRRRGRHWLGMSLEENSRSLCLGCVEAQYGDRDGRCRSKPPGSWHSPCWRGSRFFKTATTKPACRLEAGTRGGEGAVPRPHGRCRWPQYEVPAAFGLEWREARA
jgi:hypothetical protein